MVTAYDSTEVAAGGSLSIRPLARLLVQLRGRRVTGRIEIVHDDGSESEAFLRDGMPVFVRTPSEDDRLDRVLLDIGMVSTDQLAQIEPARVQTGKRLGILLEEAGIADRSVVAEALRLQMRRKVARLVTPSGGRFRVFLHDHDFGRGDDVASVTVEPTQLLCSTIRSTYDQVRLDRELAILESKRVHLSAVPAQALDEMEFLPSDAPVLAQLREQGLTLAELPESGFERFDASAVLLTLLYADMLEAREMTKSTAAASPPGAAKAGSPAAPRAGAAPPAKVAASSSTNGGTSSPPRAPSSRVAASSSTNGGTSSPPRAPSAPPTSPGWFAAPRAEPSATTPEPFSRRMTKLPPPEVVGRARPKPTVEVAGIAARGTQPAPVATGPSAGAAPPDGRQATPPPVMERPRAATASRSHDPATEARGHIVGLAGRLKDLTFFELLGVPTSAAPEEIEAAHFAAVQRFNLDRLIAMGLGDLHAKTEEILARMTHARTVLLDPKRRTEYVSSLASGDAGRAVVEAGIEAEVKFQEGEVWLRRGEPARAEAAFAAAVAGKPDEPRHQALLAWARFLNPALPKDATAREGVKTIGHVVTQRPTFARGFFFLGCLYKHLGDGEKAERAFRETLRIDRNHFDAQRELRLIEMRHGRGKR